MQKALQSPLGSKEIKPVNPKGNQPSYSLEGLMLKLRLQYFGHLRQRANSLAISGHKFEQNLGDSEGHGILLGCSPWCHKDSDITEKLNKNNNKHVLIKQM